MWKLAGKSTSSARGCIPEVVVTKGATAGSSESETSISSSTMDAIRDSPRIPIDGVKRQSERRAIAVRLRGPRRRFPERGGHTSTRQSPWAGSCVPGVVLLKSRRAVPQPYYGGSFANHNFCTSRIKPGAYQSNKSGLEPFCTEFVQ